MLSTTSSAPACVRQRRASALMSAMDSSGLVGVSTQTTRAGRSASAAATAAGSQIGTGR